MIAREALLMVLVGGIAGCAVQLSPTPTVAPALPTVAMTTTDGSQTVCAGVGLTAVLRGDPADPRVAWIEHFPGGGGRQDVVWPTGYSARFVPETEVRDETGRVVMREGDFVDGACVAVGDLLLLRPPFLGLRLQCGPMNVTDCTSGRINQVALGNGWPKREIAEVEFLSADGRYRLIFEDGSEVTGSSWQP